MEVIRGQPGPGLGGTMQRQSFWVLTSGGDAPGMNMALTTLVRLAEKEGVALWGVPNGIRGLLELGATPPIRLSSALMQPYATEGGTWLGSSRCPEFKEPKGQKRVMHQIQLWKPAGLFVLGGEGSYQAAERISKQSHLRTLCLPCSIDNDVPGTETTIGFFSALEKILRSFDELKDTGSSHGRIMILEVMGNACKDLARLGASLSNGLLAIVGAEDLHLPKLVRMIQEHFLSGARVALIAVAEKVCDVHHLAEQLSRLTGREAKGEILGHIQRGGEPVAYDRLLAQHLAARAMQRMLLKKTAARSEAVGILKGKLVSRSLASLNRTQCRWPAWFQPSAALLPDGDANKDRESL